MTNQAREVYVFGAFELDGRERLLRRDGVPIPLKPRIFQTLLVLVENAGCLLEKDELQRALWPDTVVAEANLTQNIWLLRRALGEQESGPRYIETVPRVGYRFIAPVRRVPAAEVWRASASRSSSVPAPAALDVAQGSPKSERVRGRLVAALVALLALAALLIGFQRRPEAERRPATGRPTVAILGFRNLAGRPESAWLSTALTEMMATDLAAGESLRVISGEEVTRAKADLGLADAESLARDSLDRVHRSLGADYIVSGSFVELAGGPGAPLRVDVQLQNAVTGETLAALSATGSEPQLFDLVASSGVGLRERLGAGRLGGAEARAARAAAPPSPGVARLYAEGLERLRLSDPGAARERLERAVAAAPEFPLAHAALAQAWSALGYESRARDEAGKAFHLATSLSRPELLAIEGAYRASLREWERAIEIRRSLFHQFPDDLDYGLALAAAETAGGKAEAAFATVRTLGALPGPAGEDPRIDLAEAAAAEAVADFQRERRAAALAADKAARLGARLVLAAARRDEGWALHNLGKPQPALAALEESRRLCAAAGDRSCEARMLNTQAVVHYVLGDLVQARRMYEKALAVRRAVGDVAGAAKIESNIALVDEEQGDLPAAKGLFEEALADFRELGDEGAAAAVEIFLGSIFHRQGKLAEADNLYETGITTLRKIGDRRSLMSALAKVGDVLAQRGDPNRARAAFDEALALCRALDLKVAAPVLTGGLASVQWVAGDLAGARQGFELSVTLARQMKHRSSTAESLRRLGGVLIDEGDLAGGREKLEEAFGLERAIGEKTNVAQAELDLAGLALQEGKPAVAAAAAREQVAFFHAGKLSDDEAAARILLARALLAEGQVAAAHSAIQAAAFAEHSESLLSRLELAIYSARIDGALPGPPALAAARSLEVTERRAAAAGFAGEELAARLARGEVEILAGERDLGRSHLAQLSQAAAARGYRLLARQALKSGSVCAPCDRGPDR